MTKEEHIYNLRSVNAKFRKYIEHNETLIVFLEIVPEDVFERAYRAAATQHKLLGYFENHFRNPLEE